MQNRKYGSFSSVDDPQKLSESVSSFVQIAGFLLGSFAAIKGSHVTIDDAQMQQTTDALIAIVTAGLTIWKAGHLLTGVFRKIVNKPE